MTMKNISSIAGLALFVLAAGFLCGCGSGSLDRMPPVTWVNLAQLPNGTFVPFKKVFDGEVREQKTPDGSIVRLAVDNESPRRQTIKIVKEGGELTLIGEWRKIGRYENSIDVYVFWGSGESYDSFDKRMRKAREYIKQHPEVLKEDR